MSNEARHQFGGYWITSPTNWFDPDDREMPVTLLMFAGDGFFFRVERRKKEEVSEAGADAEILISVLSYSASEDEIAVTRASNTDSLAAEDWQYYQWRLTSDPHRLLQMRLGVTAEWEAYVPAEPGLIDGAGIPAEVIEKLERSANELGWHISEKTRVPAGVRMKKI